MDMEKLSIFFLLLSSMPLAHLCSPKYPRESISSYTGTFSNCSQLSGLSICPSGYFYIAGDVPGSISSSPSSGDPTNTIEECGIACDSKSECCSFEYSPTHKRCTLNTECNPTPNVPLNQDIALCV